MSKKKKDSFLNKILRSHKRDSCTNRYFADKLFGSAGFIFGGIMAITAVDITGTTAMLGAILTATGFGRIISQSDDKDHLEKEGLYQYRFKGKSKDIRSIASMQLLIEKLNKEYENEPEFPEDIKEEITLHLEDIQSILEKVQIFENGKEVKKIDFIRPHKEPETGRQVLQLISSESINGSFFNTRDVYLIPELTKAQIAVIYKKRAEKKKTEEFNAMALEIKELKNKAKEQMPKKIFLDKRKINKPPHTI